MTATLATLIVTLVCDSSSTIVSVLDSFRQSGKKVVFVRSANHLDIDTPGKDSDKLFQSGLDFAMLVTDRHRYLKSRHNLSDYLPIPPEVDWVVQDGEIYPSDIRLVINDEGILSEDGTVFPLDDLSLLINWLRSRDEKQTNSD